MDGAAQATRARQLPLKQLKLIPSLWQTPPAIATRPLAIERRFAVPIHYRRRN